MVLTKSGEKAPTRIIEVPFVGYALRAGSKDEPLELICANPAHLETVKTAANVHAGLERVVERGYVASVIFGLAGENSKAAALGAGLCLMPCHWAAYAAAIAKFTPLATYFAAKLSCCHPQPDVLQKALSIALDVFFYGSIALLGAGTVRRILRKREAGQVHSSIEGALDYGSGVPDLIARVSSPEFYGAIIQKGVADGIPDAQKKRAEAEFLRPAESLAGKAIRPFYQAGRRMVLTATDESYQKAGCALEEGFANLSRECTQLSADASQNERAVLNLMSREYARQSAAAASSLSFSGIARKFSSYVQGFGDNTCWCRTEA